MIVNTEVKLYESSMASFWYLLLKLAELTETKVWLKMTKTAEID